jgi:hypothetical protein
MIASGVIQTWQSFQDNSPYFQAVKTDGEESAWQDIASDYDNIVYPDGQQEQILSRLIPDIETLRREVRICVGERNKQKATVRWRFTETDAGKKMERHYPVIQI